MKIGFLFNHYAAHQVLHAAPIAFALSLRYPAAEVEIVTVNDATESAVRRLADHYPGHRATIRRVGAPWLVEFLDPLVRPVKFIRKDAILKSNLGLFARFDVMVVPEQTSLRLKAYPECRHLKFVHTGHGSGDRAHGFYSQLGEFDLVLVSGPKIRDRLIREGLVKPDRCRITGYSKFEAIGSLSGKKPAFAEHRPTVIYNPHFDARVSSWRKMGREVLDFFRENPTYNLIFAPHVVLYQRGLRHGARPLVQYRRRPNMLIDTGSDASIDMTHTSFADIYIGDVSSQIYEFFYRPRPCIFLNAHGLDSWQGDPSYLCWHAGRVIRSISELPGALEEAIRAPNRHAALQRELFASTFDIQDLPASARSADAIAEVFGMTRADGAPPSRPAPLHAASLSLTLPGMSGGQ